MLFGDIYTKSETYQKEGWSILEEENQVFGKDAEAVDSNINLESEDFYFYHQNKEEAKSNIDNSSKDLSDFIDSLIQDIPDPSAEEVNSGIEKILERTHPEESKNKASKSSRRKKVTFRVLFIAALLSILSFSGLYVVGSSHNVSIKNGFVSFAKDTIQIAFFDEGEEEYITIDALLTDLEMHGYGDILFPEEFINNYDVYKASVPDYPEDIFNQVLFDICNEKSTFTFAIHEYNQIQKSRDFDNVKTAESIQINDTCIYLFEFDTGISAIEFTYSGHHFYIHSYAPYSDIVEIAKTLR